MSPKCSKRARRFPKLVLLLLSSLFLLSPPHCVAEFELSKWKAWVPLHVEGISPDAGRLVWVTLDGMIMATCRADLADLRIMDDRGVETPYLLRESRSRYHESAVAARIIDRGVSTNNSQQVVCDLGEGGETSNEIEIQTSARDFSRRVDVYGSPDRQQWLKLKADAHIFDQREEYGFRNLRIRYPETSYRYLKLVLWFDRQRPLQITGAKVLRVVREQVDPELIPAAITRRIEDSERRSTDLHVQFDRGNQHLEACLLEVPERNFRRKVDVAFQDEDGAWRTLGSGNIYRFDVSDRVEKNLRIEFSELNAPSCRLRIWNADSPPLSVVSLRFERASRVLVFDWKPERTYRLFMGNSTAAVPRYDLEGAVEEHDGLRMTTGTFTLNPDYSPPEDEVPWTEEHPWLWWLAMGTAAALLGWMVHRALRELRQ